MPVVLEVEAILSGIAYFSNAPNNSYALFGMIGILLFLIIVVAFMACFRPGVDQRFKPLCVSSD